MIPPRYGPRSTAALHVLRVQSGDAGALSAAAAGP